MAIIKCPECGNDVSDKAEVCPHCGHKMAMQKCPECGSMISIDEKVCPNCGYRMKEEQQIETPQPEPSAEPNPNPKPKTLNMKIIGIVIAVIVVIALVVILVQKGLFTSNQTEEPSIAVSSEPSTSPEVTEETEDFDDTNAKYSNDELGIYFDYFAEYEAAAGQDGAIYVCKNISSGDVELPFISVFRESECMDPDTYFTNYTAYLEKTYGSSVYSDSLTPVSIGDRSYTSMRYTYTVSDVEIEEYRYAFVKDNNLYVVLSKDDCSVHDYYISLTVMRILMTLQVYA